MSDEVYQQFLDAANAPVPSPPPRSPSEVPSRWMKSTGNLPNSAPLNALSEQVKGQYYISESDEIFHPIYLEKLPSNFRNIDKEEFDPHNKYGSIMKAVQSCCSSGSVQIFSYEETDVKTIYYILSQLDNGGWCGLTTMAVYT
ncbi:hypothetical protein SPOG_04860 [Schizosaccharomyces cryophilus OY26]|uniref:Uncharacterized protein n=1 Tax=Schizosaccharomyces cryophilus (strain OY26 / ATCC MYA-4695 / CBS 11777 / NBRC 106824 / NRRL Y48691) TaxID=653667 RepID=S9VX10_SCHCR|nr:uncharacterized protein SPOG_04860 [Schizosaccharomyces cryophilus OY26]EPY52203.1 hypothetical protein SPOG_04860 [Schizosaccharomyces cryophilus OY26]